MSFQGDYKGIDNLLYFWCTYHVSASWQLPVDKIHTVRSDNLGYKVGMPLDKRNKPRFLSLYTQPVVLFLLVPKAIIFCKEDYENDRDVDPEDYGFLKKTGRSTRTFVGIFTVSKIENDTYKRFGDL